MQRYEVFSITKASDHAKITKCVQKRLKDSAGALMARIFFPLSSSPFLARGGEAGREVADFLIGRQRPPRDVEAFVYGHCKSPVDLVDTLCEHGIGYLHEA